MGSCKYLYALFTFIIPSWLDGNCKTCKTVDSVKLKTYVTNLKNQKCYKLKTIREHCTPCCFGVEQNIHLKKDVHVCLNKQTGISRQIHSTKGALWEEEEAAEKFIALEDTLHFHKELGKFNKDYGEKWIVMPDGNGSALLALMEMKNPGNTKLLPSLTSEKTAEQVKLFLHTPEQKDGVVLDASNLDKVTFNPSNPTRIICHGWMASSNSTVITNIRDAYLANNKDNVIAVDWSSLANDIFYPTPAKFTHSVGQYIGSVIDNLVDTHKARYSDFHIIGHSLGAHVAGFAGSSTKEKIGRITGLDPALPGFQYVQGREGRLDDSDANFVDVIHTCSGLLGISIPAGHVDFYPNGGSPYQPGCCGNPLPTITQACSHSRSHEFFAESINKKSQFSAIKCNDWEHFKRHHCEKVYALMGEHVSRDANGVFYLTTNDEPPFAKGLNGTVF